MRVPVNARRFSRRQNIVPKTLQPIPQLLVRHRRQETNVPLKTFIFQVQTIGIGLFNSISLDSKQVLIAPPLAARLFDGPKDSGKAEFIAHRLDALLGQIIADNWTFTMSIWLVRFGPSSRISYSRFGLKYLHAVIFQWPSLMASACKSRCLRPSKSTRPARAHRSYDSRVVAVTIFTIRSRVIINQACTMRWVHPHVAQI